MTRSERVILLDFGVASPIRTRFAGSHAHGTPAYMSPEQRSGTAIDTRTDLYAVGLLITDCVIGKIPEDPPNDVLKLPDWLRPIVERALALDPEARWPTANAMAQALTRALATREASR